MSIFTVVAHSVAFIGIPSFPEVASDQRSPARTNILGVGHHSVEFIQTCLLCEDHGALTVDITETSEQNTIRLLIVTT